MRMSSLQRKKNSSVGARKVDAENSFTPPQKVTHPSNNKICAQHQRSTLVLKDLTNKTSSIPTLKEVMGKRKNSSVENVEKQVEIKPIRQTRSTANKTVIAASISINENVGQEKKETVSNKKQIHKEIQGNLEQNLKTPKQTKKKELKSAESCCSIIKDNTSSNECSKETLLKDDIQEKVSIVKTTRQTRANSKKSNSKTASQLNEEIISDACPSTLVAEEKTEVEKPIRLTRRGKKLQDQSTLNSSLPKSPTKLATECAVKTPARSVPKSPIKTPATEKKPTRANKLVKPKAMNETTLDKWVQKLDSIPSSPVIGRKSVRLIALSKQRTPKLSAKVSPRGLKSPSVSENNSTMESKRIPIWKTEPKPELINSIPDDVYDFEYDASERKVKKKRTRKPKSEDIYKPKRVQAATKRTKRVPRTEMKELSPKTKQRTPDETTKTTPLLKSVAEKLTKLTDSVADIGHLSPISVLGEAYDVTVFDSAVEPIIETEKSVESDVLAGDIENEQTKSSNVSHTMEPSVDNCFGFEDEDIPTPAPTKSVDQLVKSTPLKPQTQQVVVAPFSVSPVRKFAKPARKSANRPARLDQNVARDLIRGIRPLKPLKENQKQSSLLQYIREVGETENEEPEVNVPPTPPSAFTQPPRRSYSKRELRTVKRTILQPDEEEEQLLFSDEEEEAVSKPKKRVGGGKTIQKKNKRDAEADEWCKMMASHFEDIDKFNLSS